MKYFIANLKSIIILVLIGVILYLQFCSGGSKPCPEVIDVTVDTNFIIENYAGKQTKPKPDTIIKTVYLPGKPPAPEVIFQPSETVVKYLPVETGAILNDYFAKVVYNDTLHHQYGSVIVRDTISENRIQSRQPFFNFHIPEVTITKTVQAPQRTKVFAGFGVLGNDIDLVSGARVSLGLQNKRDQQFELSGYLIGSQWHFGIDTKFKITFKK